MRLLADSHLDLAWNALQLNRDLTRPLAELNLCEAGSDDFVGRGRATTTFPEMRRGGVCFCLGTLVAGASSRGGASRFTFSSVDIANSLALGQWNYYSRLAQRGDITLLRTGGELRRHVDTWRTASDEQRATLPVGLILAFEGVDSVVDPGELPRWRELGVRCASLVHYGQGRYAGGTGTDTPLTPLGREMLQQFQRTGTILDVTHLSDAAFEETMDLFDGAVFASHQNCRQLVPGGRQFTDAQVKSVIERDGVLGVACDAWMLSPGWARGPGESDYPPRSATPFTTIADQIDHICQLAGDSRHAAIGTDLDGGYGTEQTPEGLDSIADLQKLDAVLTTRGYSSADIDAIFLGNWMGFFERSLPAE